MFSYSREDEIQLLHQELEKYQNVGNEPSIEDQLKNISISKKETIKRIESMLKEHELNKRLERKEYHARLSEEKTAEARIKHKHLVEEYHECIARAVEIGENNIIEANFSLNDYTEHRHIRGALKKHLHMASVGLQRINRQTAS